MLQRDQAKPALYTYTRALSVALGYRDQLTQLHSERVQGIAADLGERCGLSEAEMDALRVSAAFHDIGKIGIPDHILLKPGGFNETEWAEMKQHPLIGEKIIASTELDGSPLAAQVIRHHHERYDGSGYPDGLAGSEIPICARIISIADSYDAMAVTRPYHRAKTHAEIMSILNQESGHKHDPELLPVFNDMIETSRFRAALA